MDESLFPSHKSMHFHPQPSCGLGKPRKRALDLGAHHCVCHSGSLTKFIRRAALENCDSVYLLKEDLFC